MKKIIFFGGGTGLSCVLSGFKLFPVDVTAVIAVSDDGSSTGVLKEELDIPAVGDVGKVLLAMANAGEDVTELLGYRFKNEGTLYNHPVRNILLAALIDIKGNLNEAAGYMSRILRVKGKVIPLTAEKVELIGRGDGNVFVGEEAVSRNALDIRELTYDHPIKISPEIPQSIADADLIVLSPGSLYTSILPHLIVPEIREAFEKSAAPIMYISNLVSQPGETDGYSVSDHVKVLNGYLGRRKVDVVLANEGIVEQSVSDVYRTKELKSVVELDGEKVRTLGAEIIADDLIMIDEGKIRHDEIKTAFLVFSYLMNSEQPRAKSRLKHLDRNKDVSL